MDPLLSLACHDLLHRCVRFEKRGDLVKKHNVRVAAKSCGQNVEEGRVHHFDHLEKHAIRRLRKLAMLGSANKHTQPVRHHQASSPNGVKRKHSLPQFKQPASNWLTTRSALVLEQGPQQTCLHGCLDESLLNKAGERWRGK